jgi:DNA polymerase III epsilon subunit-like protein
MAGLVASLPLADLTEARFWIDNRERQGDILQRAQAYIAERDANLESPFTFDFPRYTRKDADAALDGLRRLSQSAGVVVLDLETTGLEEGGGKAARVVEIAAVHWPSRAVVIDMLVRPPEGMVASDVSDITPAELALAPPFEHLVDGVAHWASECHLVTWNTRFDVPVLRREIVSAGRTAPTIRATCAMRLAAAWLEIDAFPKLDEAAGLLGIEVGGAHRAMADVVTSCMVLDSMSVPF